jgi:hypothetical protein
MTETIYRAIDQSSYLKSLLSKGILAVSVRHGKRDLTRMLFNPSIDR